MAIAVVKSKGKIKIKNHQKTSQTTKYGLFLFAFYLFMRKGTSGIFWKLWNSSFISLFFFCSSFFHSLCLLLLDVFSFFFWVRNKLKIYCGFHDITHFLVGSFVWAEHKLCTVYIQIHIDILSENMPSKNSESVCRYVCSRYFMRK